MKNLDCNCGRFVKVADDCVEVKCHMCIHNAVAEELQKEKQEEEESKDKIKNKRKKKLYCKKQDKEMSRTSPVCNECEFKSGCELWALRSK